MSQTRWCVFVLLTAVVFAGCAMPDEAAEPKGFVIVQVEGDTLYRGEPTWLKLGESVSDASRPKLFMGTQVCPIDRVQGQYVYFRSPDMPVTNTYRLYKDDALEASGSPVVAVISQTFSNYTFYGVEFGDHYGRPGDVIMLAGQFPIRSRDVAVWVGNVPAPIIHHDLHSVQFRVSDQMETGEIRLRLLKKDTVIGAFRRLPHRGEFLPTKSIDSFQIDGRWMNLVTPYERYGMPDTTYEQDWQLYYRTPYALQRPLENRYSIDRDTMVLQVRGIGANDSTTITMRFKLDRERNAVSGSIDVVRDGQTGMSGIRLRVIDMPWRLAPDGSYVLSLEGRALQEHQFSGESYYEHREAPSNILPRSRSRLVIRLVPKR
jgi:hypothetical protein